MASTVLLFDLKPNLVFRMVLNLSIYDWARLKIIRSKILSRTGRSEIGLWSEGSSMSPSLKIGTIFAIFKHFG